MLRFMTPLVDVLDCGVRNSLENASTKALTFFYGQKYFQRVFTVPKIKNSMENGRLNADISTKMAHLYIGMLLQYLFMPAGWYYHDYGLISAVPTVGLNCCDFWAQFFSRLKQTFIFMLRGCFC